VSSPFFLACRFKLTAWISYWGIFWIDASNEENAEAGFAYLGQQAGKGATFAAGMHWLSNCTEPWFLVIDNADDPDMDVSKYFPIGGNGHILITTRNPETIEHAKAGHFHFRGMDPEEAITLLLKSAHVLENQGDEKGQSRKLALGIASELGYLALALTHAGATIRRKIYTLEKYLHFYLGHRKKMLSYPHIRTVDDANIITTWEIPFQKIASRKSIDYQDAVDIMHIFAFMHFESIPEIIFRTYWNAANGTESKLVDPPAILQSTSVWDEESHARIRRALRVLCDYSIIDHEIHDHDKGFCSLHPVVHAWARGRLSLLEQKQWAGCTASVLAGCISPNLEVSGREFRRLLLPHIDSCLRALNSLYPSFPESARQAAEVARFAFVYAENGLWKEARTLQKQVVSLRAVKLGKRHEDTLEAQSSLGFIYWNLFEVKPALEVQAQVLKSRWWSRPSLADWTTWPPWLPNHVSYCMALKDLTLTLWLAGKRDLSKRTGERSVAGLTQHFGPDDPITLDAMFNLARTYLHLGDCMKSKEMLVLVIKKRKLFFGPDHPDTLMARNELGMCYRALGNLKIAQRVVSNVVESRKKVLGEEHAYTLWSINDLSKIMCDRGYPEKAVLMLEDMIPVIIRNLGEDHVGMFMTKSNLARAYGLCKRWGETEILLRALITRIPADHPDWIHAMSGYVHVQAKLGRSEETEEGCRKLLDIIEQTKVLTMDNPRTIAIAELLAKSYRAEEREEDLLALKLRIPGMKDDSDGKDNTFAML